MFVQAVELDVHVMTYALGDGADASVTKQLACSASGISHVISDTSGDQLANAMASYYKLLSPMLSPCQTRWVTYTDSLTGTELLAACIAAFETLDGSILSSCEGGLDGLGEKGDARVPKLLGVSCHKLHTRSNPRIGRVCNLVHERLKPAYRWAAST